VRSSAIAALLAGAAAAAGCGAADDGPILAAQRVVEVRVTGCSLVDEVATGFDLGGGLVMTAAHTLREATSVSAGGEPASVLVVDHRTDVALLRAGESTAPMVLAHSGGAGQATLYTRTGGRPVDVEQVVTVRIEEPRDDAVYVRAGLVLDADVTPGDSGSAVADAAGRLTGMVFAGSQRDGGPAYAVAARELVPLVEQAKKAAPVPPHTC
jgi:S1-C subfamily serine protease